MEKTSCWLTEAVPSRKMEYYDQVVAILHEHEKDIFEDGGVMPNPTIGKLYEGCRIAKENHVDLILAVGGGSAADYAKAVSVSAYCEEDPWEKYYARMEDVENYAGRSCEIHKIRHKCMGVRPDGKAQEQIAEEGLQAMEGYMREIGVVMNLAELGVTEEMIPGIVAATLPMTGGYREMAPDDIEAVLKKSL